MRHMIEAHQRFNSPYRIIQGVPIQKLLIDDVGYTQTPQMLIPFRASPLPTVLDKFNLKHRSTQMCVERTFGV